METEQQNTELVEAIRERSSRLTPFGYGIRTADDYLCGLIDTMDEEHFKALPGFDRSKVLKEAESRLTYANDEMAYGDVKTGGTAIEEFCKSIGVETPPRTLMTAEIIVTTPKKDRDNDILLTEGAMVDPAMPGLWHHMLAAPIGKMLKVLKHNSKQLKIAAAIVDMPLGHDVAVLTEFGALRISHGFRPLKFRRMESKADEMAGYVIEKFEVMEFSFVTVPSNSDAVITAFSRGKLCDPISKAWAKSLDSARPKMFAAAVAPADGTKALKPSSLEAVEPEQTPQAVTRWNRSLSKHFDVANEYLEPSTLIYNWVARFVGCEVKEVFKVSNSIPSARMGSWLTGLRNIMAEAEVKDVRNIDQKGQEKPPVYEIIQLNSKLKDDFLIDGLMFCQHGKTFFAIHLQPDWRGLRATVYTQKSDKDFGRKLLGDVYDWAVENNFLKGEAFALCGEFISKTDEHWGDVFLEPRNIKPTQRSVEVFNAKGKKAPNRGMIFMGPPGTGKTLSGRVIRNTLNGTFIWISSRDFYYAGGAFSGLTMAFDLAKELSPCCLFIEDIDNWLGSSSLDLLKTEMDGIGRSSGVMTILTTNYPESLPKALIDRPGRFHDVLKFDLPDEKLRQSMLQRWIPDIDGKDLVHAVKETDGYSGAHLYELAQFAKGMAESDELPMSDAVKAALKKIAEQRDLITESQLSGSHYRAAKDFVPVDWKVEPITKQGRVLSAANEKSLRECLGMMDKACEQMRGVLKKVESEGEPEKEATVADNAKVLIASLKQADASDVSLLRLCHEQIAKALKQKEEEEVERFLQDALSR